MLFKESNKEFERRTKAHGDRSRREILLHLIGFHMAQDGTDLEVKAHRKSAYKSAFPQKK
ncbi:MAG: hypothetical protein CVU57_05220 [Deltaproteobacteria bacterium HGW-Deltaproteobacteria-15]|nr:MAG: hypothetical protein CVU57_05220 [Deltaproteobacteria bacterium HGW-Deltaproteobacteria-15]